MRDVLKVTVSFEVLLRSQSKLHEAETVYDVIPDVGRYVTWRIISNLQDRAIRPTPITRYLHLPASTGPTAHYSTPEL